MAPGQETRVNYRRESGWPAQRTDEFGGQRQGRPPGDLDGSAARQYDAQRFPGRVRRHIEHDFCERWPILSIFTDIEPTLLSPRHEGRVFDSMLLGECHSRHPASLKGIQESLTMCGIKAQTAIAAGTNDRSLVLRSRIY
jgi:hypothetical protein